MDGSDSAGTNGNDGTDAAYICAVMPVLIGHEE